MAFLICPVPAATWRSWLKKSKADTQKQPPGPQSTLPPPSHTQPSLPSQSAISELWQKRSEAGDGSRVFSPPSEWTIVWEKGAWCKDSCIMETPEGTQWCRKNKGVWTCLCMSDLFQTNTPATESLYLLTLWIGLKVTRTRIRRFNVLTSVDIVRGEKKNLSQAALSWNVMTEYRTRTDPKYAKISLFY